MKMTLNGTVSLNIVINLCLDMSDDDDGSSLLDHDDQYCKHQPQSYSFLVNSSKKGQSGTKGGSKGIQKVKKKSSKTGRKSKQYKKTTKNKYNPHGKKDKNSKNDDNQRETDYMYFNN